jgi:hypothetical protein
MQIGLTILMIIGAALYIAWRLNRLRKIKAPCDLNCGCGGDVKRRFRRH